MGKKKKQKSKNKYGSDIIAFYGKQKANDNYQYSLEYCHPEQIHEIAELVFGKSYYIDQNDLV